MDCQAVERNLSLYVDDELEPGARLAVEVHLRRCAPCKGSLRKLASIKSCLGKTRRRVTAPDDFVVSLQSRLRQMECNTFLASQRAGTRMRRTMMYTAVGVALLMAAGLMALLALTQQDEDASAPGIAQWRPSGSPLSAVGPQASSMSVLFVTEGAALPAPPPPVESGAESSADQRPLAKVSF